MPPSLGINLKVGIITIKNNNISKTKILEWTQHYTVLGTTQLISNLKVRGSEWDKEGPGREEDLWWPPTKAFVLCAYVAQALSGNTQLKSRREQTPTTLLLSIIGEGWGVPDTGVELGVLISSIILMIFSGTLVASPQVSCQWGSLELSNSADCESKRNTTKHKRVLFKELRKVTSNISDNVLLAYHQKCESFVSNSVST